MEASIPWLTAIALLSVVALCIVLIRFVLQLQKLVPPLQKSIEQVSTTGAHLDVALPKVVDTIQTMSVKAVTTLNKTDSNLDELQSTIETVKHIVERIQHLESRVQSKVEKPIMQAASVVSGVSKAISAFATTLNKK